MPQPTHTATFLLSLVSWFCLQIDPAPISPRRARAPVAAIYCNCESAASVVLRWSSTAGIQSTIVMKTGVDPPQAILAMVLALGSFACAMPATAQVYQLVVSGYWNDKPNEDVRIIAAIDDGGRSAWIPMTDSFILSSSGNFVGE
jgi:hypothetical protein